MAAEEGVEELLVVVVVVAVHVGSLLVADDGTEMLLVMVFMLGNGGGRGSATGLRSIELAVVVVVLADSTDGAACMQGLRAVPTPDDLTRNLSSSASSSFLFTPRI